MFGLLPAWAYDVIDYVTEGNFTALFSLRFTGHLQSAGGHDGPDE